VTAPVAILTGAAGDIGRAIVQRLAEDGWRLLLTDHPRAQTALDEAAATYGTGDDVVVATDDLLDTSSVERIVETCRVRLGTPAGVISCAGVQGLVRPIHRYPIEDLQHVLTLNVVAVMGLMAAGARAMIDDQVAGSIVNLASMAGVSGAPNMPAYSAAKAAVVGLTRSAAKDLAPYGIRVNAVSPAFIGPGQMWDRQVALQAEAGSQYFPSDPTLVAERMLAMVPMRRLGAPSEVADAVGYLLSERSSYVTGVNLEVSGGSI